MLDLECHPAIKSKYLKTLHSEIGRARLLFASFRFLWLHPANLQILFCKSFTCTLSDVLIKLLNQMNQSLEVKQTVFFTIKQTVLNCSWCTNWNWNGEYRSTLRLVTPHISHISPISHAFCWSQRENEQNCTQISHKFRFVTVTPIQK